MDLTRRVKSVLSDPVTFLVASALFFEQSRGAGKSASPRVPGKNIPHF
jgi:hypothetical protein